MKIFLTGAAGRYGRAICSFAAPHGHEIVGIDRRGWPTAEPLPPGVRVFTQEMGDIAAIERLLQGCDAVIHTAALHSTHLKTHSLPEFLDANVTHVARLLDAARAQGISRFCLCSTLQVYGDCFGPNACPVWIDEARAPRPTTAYGISKLLMEALGREVARIHGVSLLSLRLGAFGYMPDDELGLKLLSCALAPADAARAAFLAVEGERFRGEAVIIGPSIPFSQVEVESASFDRLALIEKYYPGAGPILAREGIAPTAADLRPMASNRLAWQFLGWEPQFTFADWLCRKGWLSPEALPTGETSPHR